MGACRYLLQQRLVTSWHWTLRAVFLGLVPQVIWCASDEVGPLRLTPVAVTAGPWQMVGADGLTRVSVRVSRGLDPLRLAGLRLRAVTGSSTSVEMPMAPRLAVVPLTPISSAAAAAGDVVATWELPPSTAGEVRIGDGAEAPRLRVAVPPMSTENIRLAVTGGLGWPTAEDLERLGSRLGGPIDGVLVLGRMPTMRIGGGGWEQRTPMVVVRADEIDALADAVLGEPPPVRSLAWGNVTLLDQRREGSLGVDKATLQRRWLLMLDSLATWDPGLLAAVGRDRPERIAAMVTLATAVQVPLILAGGSGAGFISEPLQRGDDGVVHAAPHGCRYLSATLGGDGLVAMDRRLAQAWWNAGLTGIVSSAQDLQIVVDDGSGDPVCWQWSDVPADGPAVGSSLREQGEALMPWIQAWRTAIETTATPIPGAEAASAAPGPIAAELLWAERTVLARGEWSLLECFRLASDGIMVRAGLPSRRLAARLVADPWFLGDDETLIRRLPDWLEREAVLRWIAESGTSADVATAWPRVAAASPDPLVVRALMASLDRCEPGSRAAAVLLEGLQGRLERQVARSVPLDEDPLMQAKLVAAVFDSPQLSSTPLRALARQLEPRVAPLAQSVLRRFLERVGRFRSTAEP